MATITTAATQFQTSREDIRQALAAIQADWDDEGIDLQALTEDGDIDPDALFELANHHHHHHHHYTTTPRSCHVPTSYN